MRTILLSAAALAVLLLIGLACGGGRDANPPAADEPTLHPCEGDMRENPPPRVTGSPIDCACDAYRFDPPDSVTLTETPIPAGLLEIDSPGYGYEIRSPLQLAGMVNSGDGWLHVQFPGYGDGAYRIGQPDVSSSVDLDLPFVVEAPTVACVRVSNGSEFTGGVAVATIPVYLLPDD